jgi:hypothetical protein
MVDDGCWKRVWAEMTDSELEDRLFTYLWLSLQPRMCTPLPLADWLRPDKKIAC